MGENSHGARNASVASRPSINACEICTGRSQGKTTAYRLLYSASAIGYQGTIIDKKAEPMPARAYPAIPANGNGARCRRAAIDVPMGDHLLTQKLMLEHHETEFRRVANRTIQRCGTDSRKVAS